MPNNNDDLDQRIIGLEERIAWLEDSLRNCEEAAGILMNRCDQLERQLKILAQMKKGESAVRDIRDEVPPPHY